MTRFSVFWLVPFIGLAMGLALGLLYTWVIAPVELVNTYPALLRTDYRHDWVRLVALSYVADGDLERARARLGGLRQEDVAGAMQALIEEYAAAGRPADALRGLTALARAMDVHTPAMLVYLDTPGSQPSALTHTPLPSLVPTPALLPTTRAVPLPATSTPSPTRAPAVVARTVSPLPTPTGGPTGTPSSTPTVSPLSRLYLVRQEHICQAGQPQLQVVVENERGAGLTGVEVWLTWPGGADRAVTGLKPQKGAGYVDFDVEPDVDYALGVSEVGRPVVTGLRIELCPAQGGEEPVLGSWRIVLGPRPAE